MKIEKVHLDDYHEIVKLNDKNNLISLERLDWENLWKKNPYLENNKIKWTIGWKLLNENKELEGLILNIPFIFKHKKQEILAAVCSNYVINKNYRAHSLKLRHLFLNQPNVDLYITNTANQKSEKIMLAFKAKRIVQYDYQNRLIYILKKRKFLIKIFSNFRLLFSLNFIRNLFRKKKNYKIEDIQFKEEKEFKNIDDLENKLILDNDLYSSKKRDWLNWKYNIYIKNKNLTSLKVFKNKILIGKIIMIKNFHKLENLQRMSIVEIIGFNNNLVYLEESLKKCILIGKENKLDLIDIIGFKKQIRDTISKVGFFKKKSLNFNFLVKNDNKKLDKILFNSLDELNLSISDGDGIFYY